MKSSSDYETEYVSFGYLKETLWKDMFQLDSQIILDEQANSFFFKINNVLINFKVVPDLTVG